MMTEWAECVLVLLGVSCCAVIVNCRPHSGPTSDNSHKTAENKTEHDPTLVHTRTGSITGFSRNALGRDVHVYLGIPFAKPPLGPLRFRRPVPIDPWPGTYAATSLPNSCYQERYEYFPGFEGEEMWNPNTNISEDCLYLNLWVPQPMKMRHHSDEKEEPKVPKLPILIWIYGGGFMSGTATLDVYDGLNLAASNGVIVASVQYRIGAFGFLFLEPLLSPGSDDAPGNMGLWDQVLAIRWIKENIHSFRGDPDLITLFGESAGGGSVSLHLISPVTRGLVRRGIMQSGTINAPWSYMAPERAVEIGRQLVIDCGCNATQLTEFNGNRVMSCMRGVDPKTISKMQWNSYSGILAFPSAPTIDGHFLPKDPMELLKEGDFPETEILIGSNLDEGTYFLLYDFIDYFSKDNQVVLHRDKFLELVNTIFKNMSKLEREAIIFQYTNWESPDDGILNVKLISDIVGDYFFICPTNHFADNFSKFSKVYYYYFMQRPTTSLWGEWMGVIHGDDIGYVFGHPLNMTLSYNARERDLSLRIMAAFANFALDGIPGAEGEDWPPYTKADPKYFIFHAEENGVGRGPRSTSCAFWNDFFPRLKQPEYMCGEAEELNNEAEKYVNISTTIEFSPDDADFAVKTLGHIYLQLLCFLAALVAM